MAEKTSLILWGSFARCDSARNRDIQGEFLRWRGFASSMPIRAARQPFFVPNFPSAGASLKLTRRPASEKMPDTIIGGHWVRIF
jgi:hypothetical protein